MTWTKLNFPPHRHKYKQAGTHTRRHPHFQPFSILLHLDGCVLKSTHPPPSQPPIPPIEQACSNLAFMWSTRLTTRTPPAHLPSRPSANTAIRQPLFNFNLFHKLHIGSKQFATTQNPKPPTPTPTLPLLTSSSCSSSGNVILPFSLSSSLILFAAKFCRFIGKLVPQSVVPPKKGKKNETKMGKSPT